MASIEHRLHDRSESWRVIWRQEISGRRRKQQKAFPTADQAVRFHKLVEGQPNGDAWPPGWEPASAPEQLTFGAWARTAIDGRSRANERTKADYRRDLERHFALLVDVPLDEIDTGHVARWEADRRTAGLADKTIRNLHGFGSSIMADALSQHPPVASHNPFANRLAKTVSVRTEDMVFFTPQEFEVIARHIRDERNYPTLVRLLYGTGLRYGEATALQVRDVDLLGRRKTLSVTKAWKRTGPATWVVGEPKTRRSRRTLSLSPGLVDLLIPLVAGRRSDELLFPGAGGGRLPHIEVYKRAWAPAVARANVCDTHYEPQLNKRGKPKLMPDPCGCPGVLGKTPRIHDLRHSWVSALITEGIRLEVISRLAGHSSITITYDRYGHLDPSHDELVNAAVDRVLTPQRLRERPLSERLT